MAIAYVNAATFTYNGGVASTSVQVTIPTGISTGHTLIAVYSNVGNYRSVNNTSPSMASGWTIMTEVTATDNTYMLVAAKTATATDVSNAGTTQQIATLPDNTGTTVRTSVCAAYSGAQNVSFQPDNAALTHEASPADATINTNSATNNDANNWYVCFFGAAKGTGTATGTWTSTAASSVRGNAGIAVGGGGLTSTTAIFDSNGAVSTGSKNFNGTINYTPTRLNAAIVILKNETFTKSGTDTATRNETQTITGSFNRSDTASGNQTQTITGSFSRSDTGTRTESHTIGASFETSDLASGLDAQSLIVYISDSDVGVAQDFAISPDQGTPAEIGDYASTLVMGPATIYVADYGAPEPLDLAVGSVPSAAFWTDIGGTFDGVRLRIQYQYKPSYDPKRLVQNPERTNDRLKKRIVSVITKLAEPSLMNLLYAINEGTVTSGAGYTSFTPTMIDRATPLTYRAVIIDGWAPGLKSNGRHKRRRVILRKCLSSADVVMAYTEKKQTFQTITWIAHNVDGVTSPFKIIDEV